MVKREQGRKEGRKAQISRGWRPAAGSSLSWEKHRVSVGTPAGMSSGKSSWASQESGKRAQHRGSSRAGHFWVVSFPKKRNKVTEPSTQIWLPLTLVSGWGAHSLQIENDYCRVAISLCADSWLGHVCGGDIQWKYGSPLLIGKNQPHPQMVQLY